MRLALLLLVFVLVCGCHALEVLTGLFGSFSSPGYPKPYADNLDMEWKIQVREGYRIKLRFTAFDLEDSYEVGIGPCVYDYVKIIEGNETLKNFCGRYSRWFYDAPSPNQDIYSKGNVLNIKFVSDYSNEDIVPKGFSAHFVEDDIDECDLMRYKEMHTVEDWDELVTCNHFCNNVPASYYCSCRTGFVLHENKHTCVAKFCENRELRDDEGVIESPDYPRPYAKLSHCTWDVLVRDGLSVHFTFDREFGVEKHVDDGCVYDILSMDYNGNNKRYCGNTAPNNGTVIDMNTRHVIVKFDTDLAVEMKGFRINYNTSRIRCLKALSDPSNGGITTPNPKGYYEFEDVVNYSCNRGYDLIGSSRLECLSNGKWNHPEPTCRIKSCGEPDELLAVKYSSIVDYGTKHFTYLEVLTVKCDEWYELAGGTAEWRCEDSKQWVRHDNLPNRQMPSCRPKCGIKGSSERSLIGGLISGGVKAKKHEWPWMAFLNFGQEKHLEASHYLCGGSVISANYVLTAAHCVESKDYKGGIRWANRTHVWLGVHDRNAKPTTVKYVQTETIVVHPKYKKAGPWDYDVALIRLRETIIMNKKFRPVCLPSVDEDYNMVKHNASGTVAGWGLYKVGFDPSNTLMQAKFKIVDRDTCWGAFQSRSLETDTELPKNLTLTENMFCAGNRRGGQSTCEGDSGGPFVMSKKDPSGSSKYYEVGLVSFGIATGCGTSISYTGYTKLTKEIVTWIMDNSNNLE